jgi:phage shock protein PspC (stress-responsive transcriptional regulator)
VANLNFLPDSLPEQIFLFGQNLPAPLAYIVTQSGFGGLFLLPWLVHSVKLNLYKNMKLVRSIDNKVVAGVCGGLGDTLGIDPAILRIGFVVCTFFGIGMPVVLYLIMAAVMPKENYW